MLIEVPHIETLWVKLLRKHRHFVPDHLFFYSARTLSRLMEMCGLEVLDAYYPTRRMTLRHLSGRWPQGESCR